MNGPISLGWPALAGAAALLLLNGLLSLWLGLGLEKKLLVASLRMVVQLLLLGAVLVPVFQIEHPAPVLGLCLVMVLLAGREATQRGARGMRGDQAMAAASMLLSGGLTTVLGTAVLIGVQPWWSPQYLIPLLGMVLGNTLSGVSLGMDQVLEQLDSGRGRVEALLALGATRWEAGRSVAAAAIRSGMVPILNTMSVVGLVTIPGMMTGQILGGTEPWLAARYQILILFLIAAGTGLGTTSAVLLVLRGAFDGQHRLRPERIRRR